MSRSKSRNRAGTQLVVDRVVELKGHDSLFSTIYQQQNLQSSFATKFAQKYSLVIDGPREISKDGEILIAKITKNGVMQSFGEFLDGANFSWKIGEDGEPKTGNSIIVYADDIEESPMLITCTWKYNYTSASNQTGIMGSGTAGLTTTIQVTWAEIVQYVWTNETEDSKVALIPDGAWKDEYGDEPGGDYEYYLWRRVSKDNGATWSYFRESGLNGVGLKSITREFAKNTSSTTAPTEGWDTTYPERDSDEFIWIRDKITLTDNSVTYTTPYLATASNGWSNVRLTLYRRSESEPAPFDGGTLQYTYATNTITGDLGSWSKNPPSGTEPVWAIYATAFSNDEADTISPSEWTIPARISVEGTQGAKGESVVTLFLFQQADTRPAVPSGNVTYNIKTHAVTGAGSWSKEVPEGSAKVWVTMATAYTNTDSVTILPTAWASPEIFREKGVGISDIDEYYAVSASNTTAPDDSEFGEEVVQTTAEKKYLWCYEKVTYTDGSYKLTSKRIIGTYGEQGDKGDDGEDGIGIESITNYYLASSQNSGITSETAGFTETIQTISAEKKYLWNYEKITYTDGSYTNTEACIIGTYGEQGESAKLLDVTSDLQAFRFDKDGNPYPNQVATITVRKQGIGADTEFEVSNGMNVADNSSEIKVTPYSAGMARVKLTNSADKPWSNNNSHYSFNPTWSDSNRSYDNGILKLTNVIGYSNLVDIINRIYTIPEFESIQNAGSFIAKLKISNLEITTTKESVILQLFFSRRYKKTDGNIGYWQINKSISHVANGSFILYYGKPELRKSMPSDFIEWEDDFVTFFIRLNVNSGDTVSLELKDLMLIQPSVCLDEAFPYFAGLSNSEKKEILDTLPFFEDEFELCQTLENRSNPDKGIGTTSYYKKPDTMDYDPDSFTITFNYNNDPSITVPQYVFLGQDNLTHYPEDSGVVFYDRCEIDFISSPVVSETTQLNRIFGNEVWTHLSGNTPNEINVPIKQYENGFHKKSFLCFTSSTNGTPVFSYLKANQLPELDGSSLRLKNIVLINLTYLGWYLYFKLIGASDNEIYQWCENLPVFKDTYQPSMDTFQLTAIAGDYTDSVILSKVQDGADGEKGDKGDKGDAGTPGQDGADAQLLLLSSDVPAFRFKADGTPYPGQIATVKVTKQGISQTTEFGASNGMAIEDNASEIKVTPYMLGAKFKVKNLVGIYTDHTGNNFISSPDWTTMKNGGGDGGDYDWPMDLTDIWIEGHKYYGSCKFKFGATNVSNISLVNPIFRWFPGDYRNTIIDGPFTADTEYKLSSIATLGAGGSNSQRVFYPIVVYTSDTTKLITTQYKDVLLIDVTELEEAYPSFATLSDSEQKQILDNMPFFQDTLTLFGTLHNILPPDKQAKEVTGKSGTKKFINCFVSPIDAPPSNDINMSIADLKFSRKPASGENLNFKFDRPINRNKLQASYALADYQSYKRYYRIGIIGKNYGENAFGLFYSSPEYTLSADITFGFKNGMLLNLSKDGWEMGQRMIRNELSFDYQYAKELLSEIPYFTDTYDVPISPLTITATAGDFSDSLSIGVVQDSEAVNFSISASPELYNMTSREYVKNEQIIRLDCVKTNYTADHQAVWTLSSTTGLAFSDEAGGTEYSGTTRQADTVWVKVKEGCLLTSFKVTCSLEGLGERERTISASIPNFKPEYIQVVRAYEEDWSFPTSTADGPVKAGDMIIYVTEDANGVRQSTYRKFIGGDPSTASNWVSAVMTNSENSQLMIDGLYDALMEEASNASVLDMVKQLVAQYIAAQFINITGAIFGGPRYELQDDKVVDLGSGVGFYLSKEGILRAVSAYFTDTFISGDFETKDANGIILKTSKEQTDDTILNDYTNACIGVEQGGNVLGFKAGTKRFYAKFSGDDKRYESLDYAYFTTVGNYSYLAWAGKIINENSTKENFSGSSASGYLWYHTINVSSITNSNNIKLKISISFEASVGTMSMRLLNSGGAILANVSFGSKNRTYTISELNVGTSYKISCGSSWDDQEYTIKVEVYDKSIEKPSSNCTYAFIESHGADSSVDEPLDTMTTPPLTKIVENGYSKQYNGPVFAIYKDSDDTAIGTSAMSQSIFTSGFPLYLKSASPILNLGISGTFDTSSQAAIMINEDGDVKVYNVSRIDINSDSLSLYDNVGKLIHSIPLASIANSPVPFLYLSIPLLSSKRGLITSSIYPSDANASLGSQSEPYAKSHITQMNGNVNSEGTDYQVWGAVFN